MIPLKDNIPSEKIPFVNFFLIGLNTVVFLFELMLGRQGLLEQLIINYGLIPYHFFVSFPERWFTLLTSMFLHGGWLHFIGNMLYLYIFGDNIEDRLGHLKYFVFYITCGLLAASAQLAFSAGSGLPMIGASGAIGGVMGAYFLLFPTARIHTLIPFGIFSRIVAIPSFFYLGFWFVIQFWSGAITLASSASMRGGVAFWAHIGGFLGGVLWILVFYKRRGRPRNRWW